MAFLFADLEGSTSLVRSLGPAYRDLLHRYHAIVLEAASACGGDVEATEGDGIFCSFPTSVGAVDAAVDIQTSMAGEAWPNGVTTRCRIGVHVGEATPTSEGLVGIDVHRGARIGASAQGGQILLSTPAAHLVAEHATERGWAIVDIGAFMLDGLGSPERIARLDVPGLPVVVDLPRARRRFASSLPSMVHPIVGRSGDLDAAAALLSRPGVRMVTITGPGGTGKTRLAVELAALMEHDFADGVVFVDVSSIRERDRFLPAVGRQFGIRESGERSIPEAFASVVGDARMLIIIDNMEQVLAAAQDVADLLESMPNVRFLVTSRSPLRIRWEYEYPLDPLSVPPQDASFPVIAESDAVELFVERARAVRPDFDLDVEDSAAVAEITRRLDGLPLALELAAARLRFLTVSSLLEHLDSRLRLLERGPADAPERHRTLRSAIEWSHDLLDDHERVLFRRLGVFSGGWTIEAATAVCVDAVIDVDEILRLLEELVAKSLVVFGIDEGGQTRYRMLETLREFSLEQLRASGEEEAIRASHLRWCVEVTSAMENVLATPRLGDLLDSLERERFNMREAVGWSLATGEGLEEALRLVGQVPLFWDIRGYVTEGVLWTSGLLDRPSSLEASTGRALALDTLGWLSMLAGDPETSEASFQAAGAIWRSLEDGRGLAWSLAMHGMTTYNLEDLDGATALFDEATELGRSLGLHWLSEGWCVYGRAHVALSRGDFLGAHGMLEATLEYSRSNGLMWGVGHSQLSLGVLAFMTGDLTQAAERLTESLLVRQDLKDSRGIGDCLGMFALIASVNGDHVHAARLLGSAKVTQEASGHRVTPWQVPLLQQAEETARRALGTEYERRFSEGRDLGPSAAVALAVRSDVPAVAGSVDTHVA
ncbi:MAG TPA: AAA family ATPase [Acidimicrobiia bacterium]|nr:AAA family ATPase [Acidimicrobiia bacterium]